VPDLGAISPEPTDVVDDVHNSSPTERRGGGAGAGNLAMGWVRSRSGPRRPNPAEEGPAGGAARSPQGVPPSGRATCSRVEMLGLRHPWEGSRHFFRLAPSGGDEARGGDGGVGGRGAPDARASPERGMTRGLFLGPKKYLHV
jgi:hypothetical protein